MQKNAKKASILLWSIFISLLLGALFITTSIEIQKNLKNNSNFGDSTINKSKIEKIFYNNEDETYYALGNNQFLLLESKNKYIHSFKKDIDGNFSHLEIPIPDNTTFSIDVLYGAIEYNFDNDHSIITNKTILENNDGTVDDKNLIIKSISGYAKILIKSNNPLNFPTRKYQVIQRIGHKNIVKKTGIYNL